MDNEKLTLSSIDNVVGPFTSEEHALIEEVLELLSSMEDDSHSYFINIIVEKMNRLFKLHSLALEMPPPVSHKVNSSLTLDFNHLIEDLNIINPHDFELRLPIRTIMGKALIDMEISFWAFLSYSLDQVCTATDIGQTLNHSVENFLCDRIFNKMTSELLVSVATNDQADPEIRKAAIKFLLTLWENASIRAMRNFAPLMESIWRARRQAKVVMGTMMGIREILDLLAHGATPHFLDFLSKNSENQEVIDAFREFIFGTTYEELRQKDKEQSVNGIVCVECEDTDFSGRLSDGSISPMERALGIYRFFTKRKMEAKGRMFTGTPGPKRTAEEYLLIYFIENKL
ncbi:MAG: hypothetical protein JXR95_10220 [Deltaproteobacteria bacterium]|nr:hypothetical protein [Deltaproteobacteria bacterium]